jgi:hypothetical protein
VSESLARSGSRWERTAGVLPELVHLRSLTRSPVALSLLRVDDLMVQLTEQAGKHAESLRHLTSTNEKVVTECEVGASAALGV